MIIIEMTDWKYAKTPDTLRSAIVKCPGCGRWEALMHTIKNDGTVTPSLVCSIDGCNFHDYVKLKGWLA